ncbi:MAG: hypothetical protein F9K29_21510 [Hyphomicrobiaceae bacterium]|nr:MAG: hypothetical protein F9K29_21510 [Hyphomicrobiaceae bacterium]
MEEYGQFPADLEVLVRRHLRKDCRLPEAEDAEKVRLRGRPVKFYRNAWLGYVESEEDGAWGNRRYFLTRPRARRNRIIPVANVAGSVDRANRRFKLLLTRENVADYLNFYYAFTPKDDPMLSNLPGGATQFAVPRSVADFRFEMAEAPAKSAISGPGCTEGCLVRGAVWHFLDRRRHEVVVPLRYRKRPVSPFKASGRIPIQFRHAVFASDFKVPATTGVPVLSNIELLYQSNALKEPEVPPTTCLPIPKSILRMELWETIRGKAKQVSAGLGSTAVQLLWFVFVAFLLYFWGCIALFSAGEWREWEWVRDHFQWWSGTLGWSDWPTTAFWWAGAAIFTFLWAIVLTTHRDKVFNWIFRLCPHGLRPWMAGVLNHFVTRWDAALTAQNTFSKRVWWSAIHLVPWGAYLVFAFASLQILWDLMEGQQPRPAQLVVQTLLVQAGLNLPFVTFLLIQVFGLGRWLDPVIEGVLDYTLLGLFQIAMGLVVFGGLYRVWVFTVEASPYTFFRRLRHHPPQEED